jgi:putative oxidoreductase
MKYLNQGVSIIFSLPYIVFGLNYFFNFIALPPMAGDAGKFMDLLSSSKYLLVVKVLEVVCGFMILANFQRPLALLLIAPISINILLYEVLLAHQPGIGVLLVVLNAFLIFRYRAKYASIVS